MGGHHHKGASQPLLTWKMLNFKWTSARVGVPLAQVRESAITSSRHVLQQWEIKNGKSEVSSITFIGWALFSTCGNLVVTRASNPLVASLPTILDLVLRWMNIIILPQSRISSSSAEILYSGGFSSSTITEFFHNCGFSSFFCCISELWLVLWAKLCN